MLLVIALVACGSLAPFRFSAEAIRTVSPANLVHLHWAPGPAQDLLVNVLLYVPVGLALRAWVGRRVRRASAAAWIAGLLGGLLSWLLESTQTLVPVRYPSWVDVVLNSTGAMTGALLAPGVTRAWRGSVLRMRAALAGGAWSVVGLAMTLGLIVRGLAPFEFATDAATFGTALRASRWLPFAERRLAPADRADPGEGFVSALGTAGVFTVLGVVTAMGRRSRGGVVEAPIRTMGGVIGHGVVLAVLVEVLRLFVRTHAFDTSHVLANTIGVGLGAWFAVAVMDRYRLASRLSGEACELPPAAVALVAAGQIVYLVARAVPAFGLSSASVSIAPAPWTPGVGCVVLPLGHAAGEWIAFTLCYGSLAGLLALYQWLKAGRVRWRWVGGLVVATSLACELAQLASPARVADVTRPMLAAVVVCLCHLVVCHVQDSPVPTRTGR